MMLVDEHSSILSLVCPESNQPTSHWNLVEKAYILVGHKISLGHGGKVLVVRR